MLEAVDWSKQGEQKQDATSAWGTLVAHLGRSDLRRRYRFLDIVYPKPSSISSVGGGGSLATVFTFRTSATALDVSNSWWHCSTYGAAAVRFRRKGRK